MANVFRWFPVEIHGKELFSIQNVHMEQKKKRIQLDLETNRTLTNIQSKFTEMELQLLEASLFLLV